MDFNPLDIDESEIFSTKKKIQKKKLQDIQDTTFIDQAFNISDPSKGLFEMG